MKIVLAPDKFKNSLTGLQFCNAVEQGIGSVDSDIEIIKLPLADGGDGTIEVMHFHLNSELVNVVVNDPFFNQITAAYLYSESSKIAFIEMAEASGVKLLKPEQLDCKNATTLGTGELIVDALNRGTLKIILGIGGSATNNCGIGMASALGYQFIDKNNKALKPIGANLSSVKTIDMTHVDSRLSDVSFKIACDVTNPLYGKHGAAHIYASQKGASKKDINMLDKGLEDFSNILNTVFNVDVQQIKGGGAAGGMGVASKVFLNGELESGIHLIKKLANFETQIEGADWIITGEGKLDAQTFSGKTIKGVMDSAKEKGIKVAAFCGAIDLDANAIKVFGIDYVDMVGNYAKNKEDAMAKGYNYVKEMAKVFARRNLV